MFLRLCPRRRSARAAPFERPPATRERYRPLPAREERRPWPSRRPGPYPREARRRAGARPPRPPPGRCRRASRPPDHAPGRARRRPPCFPRREVLDRRDQAADVARVEADRRLVEHVERVDQPRAQRGGQRDPPGLAARERPRRTVERQVVEADPVEIIEPAPAPARGPAARPGSAPRSAESLRKARASRIFRARQRGNVQPPDLDRQRLGPEPGPLAVGTGLVAPPAAEKDADGQSCTTSISSRLEELPESRKSLCGARPS